MLNAYTMPVNCSKFPAWLNIPVNAIVSIVDHTYVTSSQGHKWACNGRDRGGNSITKGYANPQEADCIYGKDLAGIQYLITGVCHQIANRTLAPASVTVNKAKGYFASVSVYSKYGFYKAEWVDRQKQCKISGKYQISHKKIFRALISQRIAFRKRFLTESELSALYPDVDSEHITNLEEITRNWKIQFLDHAIEYFSSKDFRFFQRAIHQDLNQFIKSVASILGMEEVARLLNLEEYNDNTYILLFLDEQTSVEPQS